MIWLAAVFLLAAVLLAGAALWLALRSRNMQIWIGPYLKRAAALRSRPRPVLTHVYFCFADHFEPYWRKADPALARRRARRWIETYPELAQRHRDSDGKAPKHSFFYPAEEYDAEILEGLAQLCRKGYGDVEVHLHHDNDTTQNLRRTLDAFKRTLFDKHGLLRRDPASGEIEYCFIHGNWALDNSRADGRWCGVDNELAVLLETGCKADMTMPSAPSDTQTRKVNSIYFARGRAGVRKAHDSGRDAAVGAWGAQDELLLIQGPLALNWRERKLGLLPRIESGEISADAPPTLERARLWGESRIGVQGSDGHVFIKVHTHGAEDRNTQMLLEGGFERLWTALAALYRDRPGYALHYVSAWEMYQKVRELARQGGE